MAIEQIINVGNKGRIKYIDRTDEGNGLVEFWAQSLSPVAFQYPWTYSFPEGESNGSLEPWKSYNFPYTTLWQKLAVIFVGSEHQKIMFWQGNTGTTHFGGATNFPFDIYGYIAPPPPPPEEEPEEEPPPPPPRMLDIKVDGHWYKALPYVNVNGVWELALPFVRTPDGWNEIS